MAKAGLKGNGTLKKGYKFVKGKSTPVKVSTAKKKPTKRKRRR
ncbi:hypothetical protein QF117_09125 [Vibrio sp. YMD68]|nr:hypothetical protein [Vibrio sp. YMD68]WGW00356.1 hypothetical protein QF117_21250 [Vibrio sp. YMD68]WGW00963.1 hypothetical protein QF117_09125 [Vibrio sp. YMD68]